MSQNFWLRKAFRPVEYEFYIISQVGVGAGIRLSDRSKGREQFSVPSNSQKSLQRFSGFSI